MSGNVLSKFRDSQAGAKQARAKSVLQQALEDYWQRQGRMAREGLQMADQGANAVRGGDMSGLAGVLLGPAAYLGSPVSALFPERSEVEAATDVPDWSKPLIAGGLEAMAVMAPGPKGKGLGRGIAQLADDATDAERAALRMRLDDEVQQAMDIPPRQYTPEEIARLKARLAAARTPEDDAIAAAKRYIPPIEDFIPPSRKPRN